MSIVVAHLDGFCKTVGRVAAAAGCAGLLGDRVVLYVPCAPVERGFNRYDLVAGRKTHQRCVVHFWRINHALRAQQIERVKMVFDLRKRLCDLGAKLPFNPLTTTQAVAVLAAIGPFVVAHQC